MVQRDGSIKKKKDLLISDFYLTKEIKNWRQYLADEEDPKQLCIMRKHIETGRQLGGGIFIEKLEEKLGIILKKKKPGPKPGR